MKTSGVSWQTGLLGGVCAMLALVSVGCKSDAEKKCEQEVSGMEARLRAMNPGDPSSVQLTLQGLEGAKQACQKAGKQGAVSDIETAEKNFQAHLKKMAGDQGSKRPSALPLAELEKMGDPNCPRGQSYIHPVAKKEILCSGAALFEMDRPAATAHFSRMGYQLTEEGNTLEVRKETSAYRYTFEEPEGNKRSKCLQLQVVQGQTFEQAIAMATNVLVKKIERGKPLVLPDGEVPFVVNDKGDEVALGQCAGLPALDAPLHPAKP